MQNLNTVTLEGFLTDDPNFRFIREGIEFAAFRMATNHDYRGDDGEIVKKAYYHNIVVKIAPTVKAIRKRCLGRGAHVLISGRLETREYQSGDVKRYITEVVANPYSGSVRFLDKNDSAQDHEASGEDA